MNNEKGFYKKAKDILSVAGMGALAAFGASKLTEKQGIEFTDLKEVARPDVQEPGQQEAIQVKLEEKIGE